VLLNEHKQHILRYHSSAACALAPCYVAAAAATAAAALPL
jgi:hypothetical protein